MDITKEKLLAVLKELPDSYQTVVHELIKSVESSTSYFEAMDIHEAFIDKYTAIPQIANWFYDFIVFNLRPNRREWICDFSKLCTYNGLLHLFNDRWKIKSYHEGKYLRKLVESHFQPRFGIFRNTRDKIFHFKKYQDLSSFPLNRFLPYTWKFRQFSTSFLSKELLERCELSHNQSLKIIAVKDDEERWLALLKRTKDVQCVVQNVECRIGENPGNKKIWRLYWEFLKEQQLTDLLLHSYSRYCRLFFEDRKHLEAYKVEVERCSKQSQTAVRWKLDIMKFEKEHVARMDTGIFADIWSKMENFECGMIWLDIYFESSEPVGLSSDDFAVLWLHLSDYSTGVGLFQYYFDPQVDIIDSGYFEDPCAAYTSLSENLILPYITAEDNYSIDLEGLHPSKLFTPKNAASQHFSLPPPMMSYLLKLGPDSIIQKLYFSSKWFFMVKRLPVCFKLDIADSWGAKKFYENTLFLSSVEFVRSTTLPNFCFTKILSLHYIPRNLIPDVIWKVSKFVFTELHLKYVHLTLQEFRRLTEHVETLILNFQTEIKDKGERVSTFEIIDVMPKVKHAVFNKLDYVFSNGYEPKSKKSLETFYATLNHRTNMPPPAICKFIESNAAKSSHFSFDIHKLRVNSNAELDEGKVHPLLTAITHLFDRMSEEKPSLRLTLNRKDYYF